MDDLLGYLTPENTLVELGASNWLDIDQDKFKSYISTRILDIPFIQDHAKQYEWMNSYD